MKDAHIGTQKLSLLLLIFYITKSTFFLCYIISCIFYFSNVGWWRLHQWYIWSC